MLGIFLFLVLPVTAGGVSWYLANQWSATDGDQSSAELIAEQKQRLSILQKHVNKIQRQSEASLDALSLQLGRMQAESMRSNALGQRLAEMAGLDKSEFDFSGTGFGWK